MSRGAGGGRPPRRFLACAVAAGLAFGSSAIAAEPPPEAEALQQLAKSGSDLSTLHRMEFYLRFHSEDEAATAVGKLDELAFATSTEHDDTDDSWVVIATKNLYPAESALVGLRALLTTVAADGHGSYEGWRAHPQK